MEESWQAVLPGMLRAAGLPDAGFSVEPLTGGVSSDIVKVTLADGRLACAKRALKKLKVASDWQAPLERNHYEVAWLRRAAGIVPGAVPDVLAEDRERGIALLEYLPAGDYVLWKSELLAGRADSATPAKVADVLGRIHAATLGRTDIAAEFPTDHLIDALRLDPYLRFTAGRHPEVAEQILAVLATTATTKLALVHGDVSPKNILVAKSDGHPVLLDAECAWYGDPAFDGAFCLNHLLLKAVHLSSINVILLRQAGHFARVWLEHFPADLRPGLERRTAALLPCLLLARVDGKSPVEYLGEADRERIRRLALPLIANTPQDLSEVIEGVGRA